MLKLFFWVWHSTMSGTLFNIRKQINGWLKIKYTGKVKWKWQQRLMDSCSLFIWITVHYLKLNKKPIILDKKFFALYYMKRKKQWERMCLIFLHHFQGSDMLGLFRCPLFPWPTYISSIQFYCQAQFILWHFYRWLDQFFKLFFSQLLHLYKSVQPNVSLKNLNCDDCIFPILKLPISRWHTLQPEQPSCCRTSYTFPYVFCFQTLCVWLLILSTYLYHYYNDKKHHTIDY